MVIDAEGREKKRTNSGPLRESADKHSIYTIKIAIETLHKFIGEADTHNLRSVLHSSRHVALS
jgi:hypothetical protein